MNQSKADIELIRKYFNGELSPTNQYELEKRALEDPFLQDAMDGFEQFSIAQKALDDLDKRLTERLHKKEKPLFIRGFKQWSIAASLIFGIAVLSIYFNQIPENKVIAVSELQNKERLPKSVKILEDTFTKAYKNVRESFVGNNSNIAKNSISLSAKAKDFLPLNEATVETLTQMNVATIGDSAALNEVLVVGNGTQSKRELSSTVSKFKADEVAKLKSEATFEGRISGQSNARKIALNINQVSGKVLSIENGAPLTGVQVKNTKNNTIVYTTEGGEFKIEASENEELRFQIVGFETETIVVTKKNNLKITLKNDPQTLAEIPDNSLQLVAGPKGGWKAFRKYLDQNAKLSSGETGRVVVQFYIQPDGKLSDFLIQKSYNTSANNKAIQLIKDYSVWYGLANGKAQKAKVTVRFK